MLKLRAILMGHAAITGTEHLSFCLCLISPIVSQVPKTKSAKPHQLSGTARLNITFRRLKPDWAARAPSCHCNRQSVMRCRVGRLGKVAYHYKCDNSQGPECGFWQNIALS